MTSRLPDRDPATPEAGHVLIGRLRGCAQVALQSYGGFPSTLLQEADEIAGLYWFRCRMCERCEGVGFVRVDRAGEPKP